MGDWIESRASRPTTQSIVSADAEEDEPSPRLLGRLRSRLRLLRMRNR
jgi:hypothetical protein